MPCSGRAKPVGRLWLCALCWPERREWADTRLWADCGSARPVGPRGVNGPTHDRLDQERCPIRAGPAGTEAGPGQPTCTPTKTTGSPLGSSGLCLRSGRTTKTPMDLSACKQPPCDYIMERVLSPLGEICDRFLCERIVTSAIKIMTG